MDADDAVGWNQDGYRHFKFEAPFTADSVLEYHFDDGNVSFSGPQLVEAVEGALGELAACPLTSQPLAVLGEDPHLRAPDDSYPTEYSLRW